MRGLARFSGHGAAASPRLGGSTFTSTTGYPWVDGDILYASDLNAAFQPAVGVSDGSNATAGNVGEYVTISLSQAAALPLTTNVPNNAVGPTFVGPGDWDIRGTVCTHPTGGTTVTYIQASLSLVSGTLPPLPGTGSYVAMGGGFTGELALPLGVQRVSLAGGGSVYIVVNATFSGGTLGGYGLIAARRVR